ncbi:FAM186A, partial [Symbiodinium necroappetens]
VIDPDLDRIAVLGKGKFHNAARALHRFVHREGKTLPIPISTTPLTIRKKGGGCMDVNYPILRLSDWMKFILGEAGGQFLLAGHHTWDTAGFSKVFERFWPNFRSADPSHDIYTRKSVNQRCYTIPLCLHGDEGRGLAKVPVMITNFQCVVPWMGEDHVNTHGPRRSEHSFATRLLHSILPASCYAPNDITIDGIHSAIAEELIELFENGLTVQVGDKQITVFVALIATKGDWPYVRKAYHLQTGFASTRICHLCPGDEWWDCGPASQLRTYEGANPSPFKRKFSPLRSVPGGANPNRIQPDIMHCMNLGFGKDLCASSILLLCCLGEFPGSSIKTQLDDAYNQFHSWCRQSGKTSSLKCFELKTFKVTSQPGCGFAPKFQIRA